MPNIAAFLSYVLVTSFTPGPNNIMSMSNSSRFGFKKSLPFNVGVFFGFFIIIALCFTFSMSLYSVLPSIKPIMTVVGAIYILWLAYKTFKSSPSEEENSGGTNTFKYGFLMQFVNPKCILYGLSTVSTFIVPYYSSLLVFTMFSIFLAFVGFTSTCSWSIFGALFQKYLVKRHVNIIMSLLLVYCAVSLFL